MMENIEAMLCAYVEGDLDAAGKAQIEKHLQENPQHRKLLDELVAMRELVRGLPKAKAPMDVGDSLRQKVERTMLLEDAVAAAPAAERVNRWPQFFGIAAIFLLFASLCFILYKALGPTLRPAVFTQNVAEKMPGEGAGDDKAGNDKAGGEKDGDDRGQVAESSSQLMGEVARPMMQAARPMTPPGGPANQTAQFANQTPGAEAGAAASVGQLSIVSSSPAVDGNGASGNPTRNDNQRLQNAQNLAAQSQQQVERIAGVDVGEIRRRLQDLGYGVGSGGKAGSAPVLVVVDSSNPTATEAQISQFLSSDSDVTWNAVPSQAAMNSGAATMPSAEGDGSGQTANSENGGLAGSNQPGAMSQNAMSQNGVNQSGMNQVAATNQGMHLDGEVVNGASPNGESSRDQTLNKQVSPAPGTLYVARGLTPERVDALRQTLTVPQNGSQVHVTVGSAAELATTQPTIAAASEEAGPAGLGGIGGLGAANSAGSNRGVTINSAQTGGTAMGGGATTLPSDAAASAMDLAGSVATSESPTNKLGTTAAGTNAAGRNTIGTNSSASSAAVEHPMGGAGGKTSALAVVDTVIFLKDAGKSGAAATQPVEDAASATSAKPNGAPAPATQP